MPRLPAICESCGSVFPSSVSVESGSMVAMFGSKSGPCPACGGVGEIVDATYQEVEGAVRVLSAPEWSRERLEQLEQILRSEAPPAEIVVRLTAEAPELSYLARMVGPEALPAWLALLLTIVEFILRTR